MKDKQRSKYVGSSVLGWEAIEEVHRREWRQGTEGWVTNTEEHSSRERDAETRAACRKDMQRPRKGRVTAEQRAAWGWNESSEECGVEGWLSQPEQEWLEKQIQIQEA